MKTVHKQIAEALRDNLVKQKQCFDTIPAFEKLDRAFSNGTVSEAMNVIEVVSRVLAKADPKFNSELFSAIAFDNPALAKRIARDARQ